MKTSPVFFLVILLFSASCSDSGKESAAPPPSLVGTWELVSYSSDSSGGKEWKDHPAHILYQKHLTPTHFTWVSYQKGSDQLVGMGGGTYTYDGRNYVESIEFFLPATSTILGQNIKFTAEFEDGRWHHTGFVKNHEFDVESAETVAKDSSRIEEIWRRVEGVSQNDTTLIGTWELVSYKERQGEPEMSYPGFVKYRKLITPTHFAWVQYNDDGDYISGVGTGTYSYDGKVYKENIEMMHPAGSVLTGATIEFNSIINGNRWLHFAEKTLKGGHAIDSIYIDEQWKRFRKNSDISGF